MARVDVWHITERQIIPVSLPDGSSLDEVTRQLPEGYYSTFRTFEHGTRVLGLTFHLRRLFDPVAAPDINSAILRRELRALLQQYHPGEARVRVVMTRHGKAYLALEPLRTLPREVYEQGVRVETLDLRREHPELKSTSFIVRSSAERNHLAQQGIFEALLVNDGMILEGMTSNFFYVSQARVRPEHGQQRASAVLCTAPGDILPGVTRQMIIDIAEGRGLTIRYEPLQRNQLELAREAFITSSSRGVVPVIQIDMSTIGEGRPGPVTRELVAAYEAYVLENAEPI